MQKVGYSLIAAFTLPEKCWTDDYFIPREAAERAFLKKHPGNKTVEDYMESSKYEVELYAKYKQHYGYVFLYWQEDIKKADRICMLCSPFSLMEIYTFGGNVKCVFMKQPSVS